jgi:HEAT repeat protein
MRALDYLEIRPAELGFDKLYADDDTFRLDIVEQLLADPLKVPGYQTETLARLRAQAQNPRDLPALAALLGELAEAPEGRAPAEVKDSSQPAARLLVPEASSPFQAASDGLVRACAHAERSLDQAFAGLSSEDRTRILMLAPAFWGNGENPGDVARKGALHFELGAKVDTTLKWTESPILNAAIKLTRPALTRAADEFLTAVLRFQEEADSVWRARTSPLPELPARMVPGLDGVEGGLLAVFDTPWGLLVVGGPGANTYPPEALRKTAFLFDPDGDDVYRGRPASAVGGLLRPFSALIDGSGDDLYEAQGRTFSVAGAVLGLSALIDVSGNDVYRADDGSLGGAFFGAAFLYDGAGSDLFDGRNLCEGAGAFGLGALISQAGPNLPPQGELEDDRAFKLGLTKVPGTGAIPLRWDENDTYLCARQSQGFASTYGIGFLYDKTGNDIYRAGGRDLHRPLLPNDFQALSQGFSIGFRPRAGGGIGILCDEAGNDFYDAEVYSQGASYWYSVGLLFDGGGNDRYLATQYSQGAGIHLSVGSLWDRGGDDHYVCKLGVTQGTAHDLSVGFQLDESGNDFYVVSDGQGMSITNSAAIFIDEAGNDVYATPGVGQGTLTWARGFCGTGIFLDLEGNDLYPRNAPAKDGAVWSSGLYALGIDLDRDVVLPGEVIPEPVLTKADSARTVEELFDTASLWEVGSNRERVKRARAALLTQPHEAMLFAIEKRLDSQDGLVYRILLDVAKAQPDSFAARIIPRLNDPDQFVQRNVIALLGEMKSKRARQPMESMLKDAKQEKNWTRLVQALGNIGDRAAAPALRPFLADGKERRRIQAAVALSALKDTVSVPGLVGLLADPYSTVRSAAFTGLAVFQAAAVRPLLDSLAPAPASSQPPWPRAVHLHTMGSIAAAIPDTAGAEALNARGLARRALLSALEAYGGSPGQSERAAAVSALLKFRDEETTGLVRLHMHDEPDPLVKRTFEKAMEDRRAQEH